MKTKKILITNILLIGLMLAVLLIPAVSAKAATPDPDPSPTASAEPSADPSADPSTAPSADPSPANPTPSADPSPANPTPSADPPAYTLTPSATTVSKDGSITLTVGANVTIPSELKIATSSTDSSVADCKVTADGKNFKATFTIKKTGSADYTFILQDKNGNNLASTIVKVNVSNTKKSIYVSAEHGTAKASAAEAAYGTEITLTATPDKGYRLKEWKVESGNVTIKDNKFKMGDDEVKIKAIFEEDKTKITVNTDGNGTAKASVTSGAKGTEVTLTATPSAGFKFKEWQVVKGDITIKDNKFTIGTKEIEIKAIFEATLYKITVTTDGNGVAIADPSSAAMGTTVSLAVKANEGYRFKSWQVIKGSVTIKKSKFVLGNSDVEIKAIFEKDVPASPSPSVSPSPLASPSPTPEIEISEGEVEIEPDEFKIKFSSITKEENKTGIAFVFTCEESDQKIKSVEMDGEKLTIEHYLLSDDERTVELRENYLESLESGEHEITFTLKDGTIARGSFNLNREEPTESEKKGPSKVLFIVIIGVAVVLAGAGVAGYFILGRSEED